ncbi:MAG: leucine-rich repeat domain-containing protein [Prevotellaceae bacterium]|nr:leucine-rich repeat domain-containing protein [Prevotellaceae bacterium]MDY6131097.1 leucine-rich repeat domain-containing protein [Prevotella sp.]
MKKNYLLLLICTLFFSFTNAIAKIGTGSIKIKTNMPIGQSISLDMLVYSGLDAEGEVKDDYPIFNENFSVDGASYVTSRGMKVMITPKTPEFIIYGDVDYLSIVGQEIVGVDVSKATELHELRINENPITSIDVSEVPKLKVFWASYCHALSSVNMEHAHQLTCISLQGTKIASIDLNNKPYITNLHLGENPNLRSIDITKLPELEELWVNGNGMEALDISQNPLLLHLECSKNNLTKLDVTNNEKLEFLSCWGNKINGETMDNLITSLVQESGETEREFCVYNRLYAYEKNLLSTEQAKTVKERGWLPKQAIGSIAFFTWEDYDGETISGIEIPATIHKNNAVWYDLNGRKIAKPISKGIYIHKGKKIMIK